MKKILLIGALALSCFAADSDLDGVPDNLDLCPNTPFLETVDKNGCSTSQLKNLIKFNIILGYEYDGYKDYKDAKIIFTSLSAKKENFKFNIYYSVMDDGYVKSYKSNDLILSFYYYKYFSKTSLKFGIKSYLPTYYNDKTDYALYIKGSYFYKNLTFNLSEKHKIYGESGTNAKDTITFDVGITFDKFFVSPYIYTENSQYDSSNWSNYAGITFYYNLTKKTGFTLDMSTNLEETSNYTLLGSLDYSF